MVNEGELPRISPYEIIYLFMLEEYRRRTAEKLAALMLKTRETVIWLQRIIKK